jgi:hypothetical protein
MAKRTEPFQGSSWSNYSFHGDVPAASSVARGTKRKVEQQVPKSPLSDQSSGPEDQFFPSKLFTMLNDSDAEGFADIVSWGTDDMAFKVHEKPEFEKQILPKYFKMTKYKSFTRQLYNYGFNWIRNGPNRGGCK